MELSPAMLAVLVSGVFVVAILYSCVGNAGASGYVAVMSLMAIEPSRMKPTALVLNILVALVGTYQFYRAGHFSWRLFWPFALLSGPLAFTGGYLHLPDRPFQILLGIILLYSAFMMVVKCPETRSQHDPHPVTAVIAGGVIGLLSGLTGMGGGILITTLMIFRGWSTSKTAAAISSLYVLINSIAALLGSLGSGWQFPGFAPFLVVAAVAGGVIGSYLGSRRLPPALITRIMACILFLAGTRLLAT